MTFAETPEQLEQTSSILKMLDILGDLFARLEPAEAWAVVYLLRVKVTPD
ncbi:hypothetical protein HRbin36_02523 [bacterium HR36]|nr:hypothetical protein HRbin36_02523 [bacterium HR36]